MSALKFLNKSSFLYSVYSFFLISIACLAFFIFSGLTIVTVNYSSTTSPGSLLFYFDENISGKRFEVKQHPQTIRFFIFPKKMEWMRFEMQKAENAQINSISYLQINPFVKYVAKGSNLNKAFSLPKKDQKLSEHKFTQGNTIFTLRHPKAFSRHANIPGIGLVLATAVFGILIVQGNRQVIREASRDMLKFRGAAIGICLLLMVCFLINLGRGNVTNYNMWYDESGQFWMAKGLNHVSPKYAEPSDKLADILSNNAKYNLDPGGYTLMLHYLTKISNEAWLMRAFSYMFFIAAMFLISCLVWKWQPRTLLAYIAGGVLLFSPLLHLAFEIRPYTLEILLTVLVAFVVSSPKMLNSRRKSLLFGILLGIGMTSRYSAVLTTGTCGLIVLHQAFFSRFLPDKTKMTKQRILNFFCFGIPIGISGLLILFFTLRHQNPSVELPYYLDAYVLRYENLKNLFLNEISLCLLIPFLIVVLIYFLGMKRYPFLKKYGAYIYWVLLLNVVTVSLSLMERWVWTLTHRSGIAIHIAFLLSSVVLVTIIWEFQSQKNVKLGVALKVFLCFCAIVAMGVQVRLFSLDRYTIFDEVMRHNVLSRKNILVDWSAYPTIRYGFEYGVLKPYQKFYRSIDWLDFLGPAAVPVIQSEDHHIIIGHNTLRVFEAIKTINPNYDAVSRKGYWALISPSRLMPPTSFRIDFFNQGQGTNALKIDSQGDFSLTVQAPGNSTRANGSGGMVTGELNGQYMESQFQTTVEGDGVLNINVRAEEFRNKNRQKMVTWIDCSSLQVNGVEMFENASAANPVSVCYEKFYSLSIPVKDQEKISIQLRCRITPKDRIPAADYIPGKKPAPKSDAFK